MAVLLIFGPGLSAQDDDSSKDVTRLCLDEILQLPRIEISKHVKELLTLLDLEAMEEELSGLIEMDRSEKKAVRAVLKEFRAMWTGDDAGDVTIESDSGTMKLKKEEKGKLAALKKKAKAALDRDDAAIFEKWLDTRNSAARKCSEKIAKSAAELGRYGADIGKRAAEIGRRAAEEAYRIKGLDHLFDGDWPATSDQMTRKIREITKKAIDLSRISEEIADKITLTLEVPLNSSSIEIVLDDKTLSNLKNVIRLKEIDWEDLAEQINEDLLESLPTITISLLADEKYRKALEGCSKGLENYKIGIGGYSKGIDEYSKAVSRVSELLRERLEKRLSGRYELSREHWEAIRKALQEVDRVFVLEEENKKTDKKKDRRSDEEIRLDKLKKEIKVIRSRDEEIRDLKKEVEELKKELRRMKEDRNEGKV